MNVQNCGNMSVLAHSLFVAITKILSILSKLTPVMQFKSQILVGQAGEIAYNSTSLNGPGLVIQTHMKKGSKYWARNYYLLMGSVKLGN